ncbi:MAG: hypothetical protein WAL40_18705 [Rhodoplanes sp.]
MNKTTETAISSASPLSSVQRGAPAFTADSFHGLNPDSDSSPMIALAGCGDGPAMVSTD